MLKKISQNLFSILFGKSFELLLNFFAITLIARYLGVEKYGIFTATVSFVYILSKSIDFGFFQIVFREFSLKSSQLNLLNNAISLRLIFGFTLIILFNILVKYTSIDSDEILYTNILFVNVIVSARFRNIRELLEIPFKSNLNMKYVMVINGLDNILLFIFIGIAILIKLSFLWIVIIYVFVNVPGFIMILYFLYNKYNFRFKFNLEYSSWLLKESFPLYGAVLLTALFQQIDVIILRSFISDYSAGIFAAALRLATPLQILPLALITTVFPLITREKNKNQEKTFLMKKLVYKILFCFSVFILIVVIFRAKEIIIMVFGNDYHEASIPFILLIASYVFFYINNMTQNLFVIYEKQRYNFFYNLLIVLVNLLLLFFLISHYTFNGAAISKLLATLVGFVYLVNMMKDSSFLKILINANIIIWVFISFGSAYFLSSINLFVFLLVQTLLISIFIIFTNFFDGEEKKAIVKIFNLPIWLQKIVKI